MLQKLKRLIGFNPVKWVRGTFLMRHQINNWLLKNKIETKGDCVGVVISPWLGTSIPWYSIAIGLMLSKAGSRVTFIVDDNMFGRNQLRFRFVLGCIGFAMKPLRKNFVVSDLSLISEVEPIAIHARESLRQLAKLNATWELRGEMDGNGRECFESRCEVQFVKAFPSIKKAVDSAPFDLLFIPGGVWGTSGIWSMLAREAGIRIGSYDAGGYRTAMLAGNGIACQLQDIPFAYREMQQNQDAESWAFAKKEAHAEMTRRKSGVDAFESQIKGSGGGDARYDHAIMLALNSSWDSAALGLHAVFQDNTDWIIQTVRFLLEQTEATVIVRQHPAERLEIAKTTDDYRTLLNSHFGDHPRLHFIAAGDKINSYELLSRIRALVVYTSTIGIEAAANGVPVITSSNSYYSDLGFVYKASDLETYQSLLKQGCTGELQVTDESKANALVAYYLTQCCNWIFTDFNPSDFSLWIRHSIDHWSEDESGRIIVEVLRNGIPVATLNHQIKQLGSDS